MELTKNALGDCLQNSVMGRNTSRSNRDCCIRFISRIPSPYESKEIVTKSKFVHSVYWTKEEARTEENKSLNNLFWGKHIYT